MDTQCSQCPLPPILMPVSSTCARSEAANFFWPDFQTRPEAQRLLYWSWKSSLHWPVSAADRKNDLAPVVRDNWNCDIYTAWALSPVPYWTAFVTPSGKVATNRLPLSSSRSGPGIRSRALKYQYRTLGEIQSPLAGIVQRAARCGNFYHFNFFRVINLFKGGADMPILAARLFARFSLPAFSCSDRSMAACCCWCYLNSNDWPARWWPGWEFQTLILWPSTIACPRGQGSAPFQSWPECQCFRSSREVSLLCQCHQLKLL